MTRPSVICQGCGVAKWVCQCPASKTVYTDKPPVYKEQVKQKKDKTPTNFIGSSARALVALTLPGHTAPFFSEEVLGRVIGRRGAERVLKVVDDLLHAVGESR